MAKVSEAQKRADKKYKREKTKQFNLRFFPNDLDVYEHLQQQENRAAYIKNLVRADMDENR